MKKINRMFFLALASFSVAVRSAEYASVRTFFLTQLGGFSIISLRVYEGDRWEDVRKSMEDVAGYEHFTGKLFFDGRDLLKDRVGYVSGRDVLEMKRSFLHFVPYLLGDRSQ